MHLKTKELFGSSLMQYTVSFSSSDLLLDTFRTGLVLFDGTKSHTSYRSLVYACTSKQRNNLVDSHILPMTPLTYPHYTLLFLHTLTTPYYPYIPSLLLSTHYSLLPISSLLYGDELWWMPKVSYCVMDYGGTLRSNGDQILLPYESAGLKDLTSKLHIFTGS